MLRLIDLRESSADPRSVVPRAAMDLTDAGDVIRPVLEDVRVRGADAVLDACERFTGPPRPITGARPVIADALAGLDPSVRRALEVSSSAPGGSIKTNGAWMWKPRWFPGAR